MGATARVVAMAQAFGEPPVPIRDEGEHVWNIGSFYSVGTLLLALQPYLRCRHLS